MSNQAGGIIDDIMVTRLESGLALTVNAGCKEKDFTYLRENIAGDCKVQELADMAFFALQGPAAANVMAKFSEDTCRLSFMQSCTTGIKEIPCTISRSGYCGEDGFEISLHRDHAEQLASLLLAEPDVEPIGLGARNTLRLEAGLCLYGHELKENISPVEAQLQWLIKAGHGDFPGANIILEQLRNGADTQRTGLSVEGRIPVREGCKIYDQNQREAGYVTSGGFSPSLKRPIAMAMLDRRCAGIGTQLSAVVRDAQIAVTVCRLPFVTHRYCR